MSVTGQIRKALTPQQMEMAKIIEREFRRAGLPPVFAGAAIVNAYYESGLDPGIQSAYVFDTGTREDSVGLFQLYIHGAGKGMVLEDGTDLRADPVINTQRIIQEVQNPKFGKAMRDAYAQGNRSVSYFSGLFAQDIERCGACGPPSWTSKSQSDTSKVKREKLALEFFPRDKVRPYFYQTWWFWTLVVAGTGSGVYLYRTRS